MITIRTPASYESERRYILSLLFREFLGLDIQIQLADRRDVQITTGDGRKLVVADELFGVPEDQWLKPSSLPRQPLKVWNLRTAAINPVTISSSVPVIYGKDPDFADLFTASHGQISLGLDIFGAAFFMLTRYEEMVKPAARDKHDRFPASASLAYQENFLERPIINEYVEILWCCLKRLWPRLHRKPRRFQVRPSHDVDLPLCVAGKPLVQVLRSAAGDMVKRREPVLALRRLDSFVQSRQRGPEVDLCDTFDFIMDLSESHGLRSSFNFIAGRTAGEIDGSYSMKDPWIRRLLRQIHERGHEIGLHPSYNTFRNPSQIRREFHHLLGTAKAENIYQDQWGGRQHFLRWEAPTTWQAWEDAGLDYDSTLTFADNVGFRCGVCYEFPVFDLRTRRSLNLREQPLILMEETLLRKEYMHLPLSEVGYRVAKLRERCKAFEGTFTLLWHNNTLIDKKIVQLYKLIMTDESGVTEGS
jgi:hypothetical protein